MPQERWLPLRSHQAAECPPQPKHKDHGKAPTAPVSQPPPSAGQCPAAGAGWGGAALTVGGGGERVCSCGVLSAVLCRLAALFMASQMSADVYSPLALFRVRRALGPDNKGPFSPCPATSSRAPLTGYLFTWGSVHPTGQSPPPSPRRQPGDGMASLDTSWSLCQPGFCNGVQKARLHCRAAASPAQSSSPRPPLPPPDWKPPAASRSVCA